MGDLQDGMLAHYQEQAKASDVNVEKRIEREQFDYHKLLVIGPESAAAIAVALRERDRKIT